MEAFEPPGPVELGRLLAPPVATARTVAKYTGRQAQKFIRVAAKLREPSYFLRGNRGAGTRIFLCAMLPHSQLQSLVR